MKSKVCFKCRDEKPLTDYYKHKQMGDGHLNKCKVCTKRDVRERELVLSSNAKWMEAERKRGREKYHKLNYKEKHKPSIESKAEIMGRYKDKYPEKLLAKNSARRLHRPDGVELHHWSYNPEHYKDVIPITVKQHAKAHRFIEYDQPSKMYRTKETGEILDSKHKHIDFIMYCIEYYDD